jgi:hypothetical protein
LGINPGDQAARKRNPQTDLLDNGHCG